MYCKLKNIIRIPRIFELKEEPLVTLQWITRNKEAFHSSLLLTQYSLYSTSDTHQGLIKKFRLQLLKKIISNTGCPNKHNSVTNSI